MDCKGNWLKPAKDMGDVAPLFQKNFTLTKPVASALLHITAIGVYEARLNGQRVGDFIMAPGWTSYDHRLQVQTYDVTQILNSDESTERSKQHLEVLVGKGWYRSRLVGWEASARQNKLRQQPAGLLAWLEIIYTDGRAEAMGTDESWTVTQSPVRFSEIYDGEIFDATFVPGEPEAAEIFDGPWETLIPQQGDAVTEQEYLKPACIFTTPKGEIVVDFGQEITGYVEIALDADRGDIVDLSFAEVMDKEGNFYTENYRSAKAQYHYTCRKGHQTWKPLLTFYGFRYARINSFPGGPDKADTHNFTAIVLHSDMKRTGRISCGNALLNQLFDNCLWGQKGNFLDVPTDCPQRDERLGWTGDAQVFVKTACLNYDAEKFFTKWLADMAADQGPDGYIGHVIPDLIQAPKASAAWGDAATICPWEIYLAYGNPDILVQQFDCMKGWVNYITATTQTPYLWTGGEHYGDWLGLDAPSGSYKGSSREEFIASAFYAHSTNLLIKAGKALGKDMDEYETLYSAIVNTFQKAYPVYETQTECVLAAHFHLAKDCQAAAGQLAAMVSDCGVKLQTGFVGTPYLLHVLSDYGYANLAYSLLLREEYPSWLYPVTHGATTIWEHWDGIMESGDFWSADMNSYNHYAYGSVLDWVYTKAAGIQALEETPGYEKVRIAPIPDERLGWLNASLDTRRGRIRSQWKKAGQQWRYEISTPVTAEIIINAKSHSCPAGDYIFFSPL